MTSSTMCCHTADDVLHHVSVLVYIPCSSVCRYSNRINMLTDCYATLTAAVSPCMRCVGGNFRLFVVAFTVINVNVMLSNITFL